MSRLLKSSGAVGAATLISRLLGFVRESVYAGFMAVGPVADAFYFAYSIPNLFRRLLGEGALTAAFIPIFKEQEKTAGEKAMWDSACAVLSALILLCGGLVLMVLVLFSGILATLTLGPQTSLILHLMRAMFPYLLFVCVAAVFIGILNARGHFFMPALGAAVLNVVMIGSVFLIAPRFGSQLEHQVFGLALGVLLAGFFQAAFQYPTLRREGFRFRWVNPFGNPTVIRVIRRMAPATLGVAAYQFNVVLTQSIAVHEAGNIVSAFNYAVRLMELPQGVVGVSLATYLLSELSGLAAEQKWADFQLVLREGLLQLLFINTLAMVVLVALAQPMVRLLFEHGKFDAQDTRLTAQALWGLAPGLLAFSLNNIFARAFYALGDTKTPTQISMACLVTNLVLAFFLIPGMHQAGMGLANTLSGVMNTVLLIVALRRKLPLFSFEGMGKVLICLAVSGCLAGAVAWAWNAFMEQTFGVQGFWVRSSSVFGAIGVAGTLYMGLCLWGGITPARDLFRLFQRHSK